MDTLTPAERSERMGRVRSKNSKVELAVRRALHKLGYRFRLHRRDLPGKPDIVLPSRRAVIFVHGCFWHRHDDSDCALARLPKSRLDFWLPKLEGNRQRDLRKLVELEGAGWRTLVVWECELRNIEQVENRLTRFLDPGDADASH
jgi:DNA mismatch endonuclease (patch repair protein)